jgi:hypothetical protein
VSGAKAMRDVLTRTLPSHMQCRAIEGSCGKRFSCADHVWSAAPIAASTDEARSCESQVLRTRGSSGGLHWSRSCPGEVAGDWRREGAMHEVVACLRRSDGGTGDD